MKETNKTPRGWISLRVKPAEYAAIHAHFEATTCRKLSQYIRKVLLQKPVTVLVRNQSADDVLAALNQLKNELSAIGNNLNQTVHKLHTLDTVNEIKLWAVLTETLRNKVLDKVEQTRLSMHQIYEQCCRK